MNELAPGESVSGEDPLQERTAHAQFVAERLEAADAPVEILVDDSDRVEEVGIAAYFRLLDQRRECAVEAISRNVKNPWLRIWSEKCYSVQDF